MEFKSPVKHSNKFGSGYRSRTLEEGKYETSHPGPGNPGDKGYHTGHKGNKPIYPTSATTTVKKGISKVATTVKGKNK